MLHEILLSLSGHPSPLLRAATAAAADGDAPGAGRDAFFLSPPERALLASVARLSGLHVQLRSYAAQIRASHPSTICRAVATAVESVHLAAFQAKVLEVESTILRKDAALVGAYHIVPLTAVVGEFSGWTRRMEWLWETVQFMTTSESGEAGAPGVACTGAELIDRLRAELQTGYADVEETARSLVRVAEVAWLKQVSAWILYGRLPSFGSGDFFVQAAEDNDEEHACVQSLLPSFVPPSTASSMLFIGKSLHQIRAKSRADSGLQGSGHLSSQLQEISGLSYPLDSAAFARTITTIRQFLSRTTLQKLLPLARVLDMLHLLRDFFLLGRGEFAMVLTQQADDKIRSRWRRAENLAYEKRDGIGTVVVKEGEVAAVLAKAWQVMGSLQGQHAAEDEGLELARNLLRLSIPKSKSGTPMTPAALAGGLTSIAPTPFRNLLFSLPVVMTLQIPSPLDLFLSQSDLQTYTSINSYLLSIRRAHIHLTDLWKITSIRRHHPPPPAPPYGSTRGGRERSRLLRERYTTRSNALRSAWATASAAIFFLSETEAYLQTEVVAGLWDGFQRWLTTGSDDPKRDEKAKPRSSAPTSAPTPEPPGGVGDHDDDDIWLMVAAPQPDTSVSPKASLRAPHDPQTLATAHRLYLRTLVRRLLLTCPTFTDSLYELLVHIDRLVALVHRLHGIWTSFDLEADAGVVDAFVDLTREEEEARSDIRAVEARIKRGIERVVDELRALEAGNVLLVGDEEESELSRIGNGIVDLALEAEEMAEQARYVPRRVGGVDRLLMKLDFGTWFASASGARLELDGDD